MYLGEEKMAKIAGSVSIKRPVDFVFDQVADIRNEPTYNPNMISAELKPEEPIGKGSVLRKGEIER